MSFWEPATSIWKDRVFLDSNLKVYPRLYVKMLESQYLITAATLSRSHPPLLPCHLLTPTPLFWQGTLPGTLPTRYPHPPPLPPVMPVPAQYALPRPGHRSMTTCANGKRYQKKGGSEGVDAATLEDVQERVDLAVADFKRAF